MPYNSDVKNLAFDAIREALAAIELAVSTLRSELDRLEASDGSDADTHPTLKEAEVGLASVNPQLASSGAKANLSSLLKQLEERHMKPERSILDSVARLEKVKAQSMHKVLVAGLAGFLPSDPSFSLALAKLVEEDKVVIQSQSVRLTDSGRAVAPSDGAILTSEILVNAIASLLPRRQRNVLQFLFSRHGDTASRQEIMANCGQYRNDKALLKDLIALQQLSLVVRRSAEYSCSEVLFID